MTIVGIVRHWRTAVKVGFQVSLAARIRLHLHRTALGAVQVFV